MIGAALLRLCFWAEGLDRSVKCNREDLSLDFRSRMRKATGVGRRQADPRARWPASLAEAVSFRLRERL